MADDTHTDPDRLTDDPAGRDVDEDENPAVVPPDVLGAANGS